MASAAPQPMSRDCGKLQEAIQELFWEFIKPSIVLLAFKKHHILTRHECELIEAETKNLGDTAGAHLLLSVLAKKDNWFDHLLKVLHDRDVKLQHIAEFMKLEKTAFEAHCNAEHNGRKRICLSVESVSSLYIEYNRRLESDIRQIFLSYIGECPYIILRVFDKYRNNVLTKIDVDNVDAKVGSDGGSVGAGLLLERLILYEDWYSVLLQVLRVPEVKLQHVADEMEAATHDTRQWYMDVKSKTQSKHLDETVPPTNNNIVTDCGDGGQVLREVTNKPIAVSNEEFESDSATMMNAAEALSHDCQNAGSSVLQGGRNLPLQALASVDEGYESGKTKLMAAAENGDAQRVMSLIKETSDIDKSDKKGRTALMYAAFKGHSECVQQLITRGCDVNKMDSAGCTSLMHSSGKGHHDCMRILINEGANVNMANKYGSTALMYAALKGHSECVQQLITSGCDVNKADSAGCTSLMHSSDKGHCECVRILIYKGADVNMANKYRSTALMVAAKKGWENCVKLLLEGKCDPDQLHNDNFTALMYAARHGHSQCVKLFIDSCCDVNKCNSKGQTALMFAAEKGYSECLKLLIEGHCDINKSDNKGVTALMYAVASGHFQCVELLVVVGKADLDKPNGDGNTAIMFAIVHQHLECVNLLINSHAKVNIVNNYEETPLTVAEHMGSSECVRLIENAIPR